MDCGRRERRRAPYQYVNSLILDGVGEADNTGKICEIEQLQVETSRTSPAWSLDGPTQMS
eukprot:scaffold705_cov402-Prasinococcus_capsulatus_cf.AAC.39